MRLTRRIITCNCALILAVSVMGIKVDATTYVDKDYNNNFNFQSRTYTEYGSNSGLVCAPYIATLCSTSSDYDNAGKSVTYITYVDLDGYYDPIEYNTNHCFDRECTANISTDSLDSGTLSNVGCRKYIARLYNNSNRESGVADSYHIKIHKRAYK